MEESDMFTTDNKAMYLDFKQRGRVFESCEVRPLRREVKNGSRWKLLFCFGKKRREKVDKEKAAKDDAKEKFGLKCVVILSGMVVNCFQSVQYINESDPVGVDLLEKGILKNNSTKIKRRGNRVVVIEFGVRSKDFNRQSIKMEQVMEIRLESEEKREAFVSRCEEALEEFVEQNQRALDLFNGGPGFESVSEFKEMLKNGLIKEYEFEMFVCDQLAQDDEILQQTYGRFGLQAIVDYSVQCDECLSVCYVIPSDTSGRCTECSTELPIQIIHERERNAAEFIRLQVEENKLDSDLSMRLGGFTKTIQAVVVQ